MRYARAKRLAFLVTHDIQHVFDWVNGSSKTEKV